MLQAFDLDHPDIQALNSTKHLMIKDLRLDPIRWLTLSVAGATPEAEADAEEFGGIAGVSRLEVTDQSILYSFSFVDFVSYAVTEEMFAQTGDEDVFEGGWVRVYTKSSFLDFVRKSTWARDELPGKLVHYQINTYDHFVDVVTSNPPSFTVVQPGKGAP